MKIRTDQITFDFFDDYRVTYHRDSSLIEIERWACKKSFFRKKWYWKLVYFGCPEPIEKAVDLFRECKKEELDSLDEVFPLSENSKDFPNIF